MHKWFKRRLERAVKTRRFLKIVMLAKRTLKDTKELDRVKIELEGITISQLDEIRIKNQDDDAGYRDDIADLTDDFRKEFNIFLSDTIRIFDSLDYMALEFDAFEFDDLKHVEDIFARWHKQEKEPVFTQDGISVFQTAFEEFFSQLYDVLKMDVYDDKKMEKSKNPTVNFGRRIKSEISLMKHVIKLLRRTRTKRVKVKDRWLAIDNQLKQGIQGNFLDLLKDYLTEEKALEIILHQMREDVKAEIRDLWHDVNKLVNHIVPIKQRLKTVSGHDEFQEGLNRLFDKKQGIGEKSIEFAHRDKSNQNYIYRELDKSKNIFDRIVHRLYQEMEEADREKYNSRLYKGMVS